MSEELIKYRAEIQRLVRLNNQLTETIKKYRDALNKIAMAQSGPMDYTQDFFEFVKEITRDVLS